jgi:glucosyl-3-phosphoglycerate synthase
MWRALAVVDTDVVVFLDADLAADHAALVAGLAGPLLEQRGVRFVKGAFHREHPDFVEEEHPFDGGRVTELMARPLVNLLRPDLAGFYQPLGGQVAADTALLRELPLFTGYAVEIGMLVDVIDRVGLAAVAEVNLGALRNRPRPTAELAPMAQEVLYGFLLRVAPEVLTSGWQPYRRPRYEGGYDEAAARVVERPPLASLV